ncbi:MAG: bifunctional diguanylate cyclase/phosphodiesterase [Coriobacteriales bacterium]|nr:bifunctional diguanylate cyclase/phosphodiesterase [Coriobacteriales bacterium]
MGVVPPRQVAVLSVANYDDICAEAGSESGKAIVAALREFAVSCGVDPGHMRRFEDNTLLLRLDALPREEFLSAIGRMIVGAHDLALPSHIPPTCPQPKVRVGAMSERALRSFVNDAAADLLAYMDHMDCSAVFLAGDELDIWQSLEATGIEFLSHEQLKRMDPFTGLLKVERFVALLQEVLDHLDEFGDDVKLLYFDIDDFKSFNRAFDHDEGDKLLLHVAHEIRHEFPTDIAAHLSVDRFAVLTNSRDVVRKCAAIHERVREFRETFAPEVKCGIFELEPAIGNAHVAIDCAKRACEHTKGRYDIVCHFFDADLKERLFIRRYVARNAELAIHEHWIKTYAQPVISTESGDLCHFEALARWDDPKRGLLSPAMFIPTLEDAHLIHKLDMCVLADVCKYLSECRQTGRPYVSASVNLSRLDFELCDAVSAVKDACARWQIPHELVAIEVTESALDEKNMLRHEMDRLRENGFEVWMDDFGCGYSSLNLLKDYEFDVLKVDMEFLRDMEGNERSKTIVASVISMAQSLGIRTLVEGVETTTQRSFLRDIGCDMMQGYLFGKPRPLGDDLLE